ncbi:hypothetical protein Q8F55_002726 [Vanrija albida]|uniref:Uncharacterized protein n=1 Tax=Vanrija albida TaxID=181172 RepID=A0ABR3QAL2_9TREE
MRRVKGLKSCILVVKATLEAFDGAPSGRAGGGGGGGVVGISGTPLYLTSGDEDLEEDYSLQGLVLGSVTDDVDFCLRAIRSNYLWPREGDKVHDTGDPMEDFRFGAMMLAPCNMPLKIHSLIPPTYIWALSRSWANAKNDKETWIVLFKDLIELAKLDD